MRTIPLGLIASFCLTVASCTYDKEMVTPLPEPNVCDSIAPTYDVDIEPIINQNCAVAGCHVATNGNGIPYTGYAEVKQKVDSGKFRTKVIDEKSMPKGGSLTEEELQTIKCWLDAGAPEN